MEDIRDELYSHMLEMMPDYIKVDSRIKEYVKEYMQRYADYCLNSKANGLERSSDKCHIQNVSNNEVAVCPKCASEDVIWTCYCNCCKEAM